MASRGQLAILFGRNVKAAREAKRLTLEAAARAAGLGIGALSEIENAKRWRTRFDQMERLATALGVPITDLLERVTRPRKVA